jgi:hypothetical protein
VLDHGGGGELGGGLLSPARLRPGPGQFGRVGVEAETDLAAALSDERREPIGEAIQEISP